ncbi:MAG: rhodanese-like domain-containing protein [Nevskia sp.]|nr:rhodanese-like domain-containing protein [Nevskia sp.]
MKNLKAVVAIVVWAMAAPIAFGQQAAATAGASAHAEPAWKYKTPKLSRAQVDALLAKPEQLVIIDVRRPDELTDKGGFPAYLSIQAQELEKYTAFIPKDRTVVTVSNHAGRAGAAADLLASKGFKVAGAIGSENYQEEGGTISKVVPPAPKVAEAGKPVARN